MKFYTSIGTLYDYIFPPNRAQLTFTEKLIEDRKDILEIGCATGNLLLNLEGSEKTLSGIDFDEEMVRIAKEKASNQNVPLQLFQLDMRNIDKKFQAESFDALISYGNTIVHLHSLHEIEDLIFKMAGLLRSGGILVLQIINYDRVLDKNIKSLPTIENEFISFERSYTHENSFIKFSTTLSDKKGERKTENCINLLPLRMNELHQILEKANFGNISYFGSFKGEEWKRDSYALVAAAIKN